MADDAPEKGSPPSPEYTVILDPEDSEFANSGDLYYKTFGSDGSRRVDPHSAHFKGDFLSLLDMMLLRDKPYVLIVTHASAQGVHMRLAQGNKHKGYEPVYATRTALSLLLVIALLRAEIKKIELKPRDKQTVEEWQTLNHRRTRYVALVNEDPLEAFRAAQRQEPIDSKHQLGETELDRFGLDAKKQELTRKPGEHTKELQALDKQIRELEAVQRRHDEEEKNNCKKQVADWIKLQREGALHLSESDLDQLLTGLAAIKSVNLKDVQIRGCNLGKDLSTMELLRLFLGSERLVAPKIKTGFGSIPVWIEGHSLARHRACKPKELLRRSGCWWSFDDSDFQLLIKHIKNHKISGEARAVSKVAKDEWVKDHLGRPRSTLGTWIPIHFLDSAPPAFPLDSEFEDNLETVSR